MIGLDRIGRREFLRNGLVFGAGAVGLAAGYAAVPDAFARAVYFAKRDGVANDRVLVMIQLAGGNDGLQTVIPLQDGKLHDLRPTLGDAAQSALPLGRDVGLNRSLSGIKSLYDKGKVAIVQGVGYPQPSFSHFDSIRVWETADPLKRQQDGWLGRTIERNYDSRGHPLVGARLTCVRPDRCSTGLAMRLVRGNPPCPCGRQPLKLDDLLYCRELTRILQTDVEHERADAHARDGFVRTHSHTTKEPSVRCRVRIALAISAAFGRLRL